jgi:transporter family-2 protein
MNWTILLPLMLGCIGILQGTINREVSNHVGVSQAVLITNVGSILFCTGFYFFVKAFSTKVPDMFHIKAPLTYFRWWFIFPALMGFLIVSGMPYAISELGAVKVTVGLIAAQMVTSVIWDLYVDNIELNLLKGIGIIFAFLSVVFITVAKN